MTLCSALPATSVVTSGLTGSIKDQSEDLEVTSPAVSLERMGPLTVRDLPRYHSLVQGFQESADHWMATGHLRGLLQAGAGYLLGIVILLSGEKRDILLRQLGMAESEDKEKVDIPEA